MQIHNEILNEPSILPQQQQPPPPPPPTLHDAKALLVAMAVKQEEDGVDIYDGLQNEMAEVKGTVASGVEPSLPQEALGRRHHDRENWVDRDLEKRVVGVDMIQYRELIRQGHKPVDPLTWMSDLEPGNGGDDADVEEVINAQQHEIDGGEEVVGDVEQALEMERAERA